MNRIGIKGTFHNDFAATFILVDKRADFVLESTVIVAGRAHENLAPLVKLDLERQILKERIVHYIGPFHDFPLFIGWKLN